MITLPYGSPLRQPVIGVGGSCVIPLPDELTAARPTSPGGGGRDA